MRSVDDSQLEQVTQLVRRCLEEGLPVEIEGLGLFRPTASGRIKFLAETRPRVFIAYVEEDYHQAERLFDELTAHGFNPWIDRKKLLPGQNWPRSIERAIEIADFFLACFSQRGTGKRGHFQAELRYALECADRLPLGEAYLIPIRLDTCTVPPMIERSIQHVDLFPDFDEGFQRIVSVMRETLRLRSRRVA